MLNNINNSEFKIIRKRTPHSQIVYDKLKTEIIENILKPSEKLIEEDLARKLEVSRTPIREALKQLEQEGLVTYFPRRGYIVSEISIEDASDIYEIREVLEGLAIKHICINSRKEAVKKFELIISEMDRCIKESDYSEMKNLHKQWTETTIDFLTNQVLKDYLQKINENLSRLRKISLHDASASMDAYRETKEIYEAIRDGDIKLSERLTKKHIFNAKKRYFENINRTKHLMINIIIMEA